MSSVELSLEELRRCFEGVVPAVIATAAADGTPNVTYLSRMRVVDEDHVALSNQFFSKTSRNLVENPHASVLAIDPTDYEEYRLTLAYERNERRGPVFDQLAADVDEVAALSGMQDVFKLRGADVYRVVQIERVARSGRRVTAPYRATATEAPGAGGLAALSLRLGRCPDLDSLVEATVTGVGELLGYGHAMLLLADEAGERLFTIASYGYDDEAIGSEVVVGEGTVGRAAARRAPARVGNLRQMSKYSESVRRSFEGVGPGWELPVPRLSEVQSRLAVPALALGQLVGVLAVESTQPAAFTEDDEAALTVVATLVAGAVEVERAQDAEPAGDRAEARPSADAAGPTHHVRYFAVDGSTFLDGEYLIKGVAGRVLWALLGHHQREGRVDFTNREIRLDPSLELPEVRDNLESRLILLKRRLDERAAPVRIEKTGRGRFRLVVDGTVTLDEGPA
jgi:adenylate cyclase